MLNISQIKFPVYILGANGKIIEENYYKVFQRWDGSKAIIDIEKPEMSFIERRRYLKEKKDLLPYSLKNIRIALFFLSDILKLPRLSNYHFIDSSGKIFKYKKTHRVKLSFEEIDWWRFKDPRSLSVIVKLKSGETLYESIHPPIPGQRFAGILHLSPKTRLLYGFTAEKFDDTTRKI